MAISRQQTCMAGARCCSNMRSSPSSNSVIQSVRMPVTVRSSSTQWTCCTRGNWGDFALFLVTVAPTKSGPLRDFNSDEGFKVALDQSIDAATAESGRANLGAVGNHLLKLLPDFDPRNYGFRKLSDLVEKNPSLRLVREKTASGTQAVYAERK